MRFYMAKTVRGRFDEVIERVKQALQAEGFGVLTDIDVKATMKHKLNVDFREYRILGACNPPLAHQALIAEDKIGTMLPCNVVVQARDKDEVEVAAINPAATMANVGNKELSKLADTVAEKLEKVISAV